MRFLRRPLLALSLFQMAVVVPAVAQTLGSSSYAPACDDSKVTRSDRDRAHTVFLSGKQYLEEANYDKAISYFKDAYSIDCSVHGILPIIATAYERKGDRAGAIAALEEYVKRAPTASDREIIERRIKNLKDQLAQAAAAAAAASAPSATSTATPAGSGVSPAPTEPTATSTPWAS